MSGSRARSPSTKPTTDYTKPVPWVIVVDPIDYEKACEAGRALGSVGVTGRFMNGSLADAMHRYKKWIDEHPEVVGGGEDSK